MSWERTHRYYAALREIETELDRRRDGIVAWRPEFAELFGTPDGLLVALRSHWTTMVHAQAEEPAQLRRLVLDHIGLALAVVRADVDSEALEVVA